MSCLIEDSWIPISVSAFTVLWYIVFVDIPEENLDSYRYAIAKGRIILIAFSESYVYSSLMLHQHSTRGSFLEISCYINLKHIMSISYSVPWKFIGLCYTRNGSFTCEWFYSMMCWSFGKYCFHWVMQTFQMFDMFYYVVSEKSFLLIWLPISSAKLWRIETIKLIREDASFSKF